MIENCIPLESLGTVSYSHSIVSMAVSLAISEIFSVREWSELEIWVWGRSRSLKMVPFDRPYRMGQIKRGKLTFWLVTSERIYKIK